MNINDTLHTTKKTNEKKKNFSLMNCLMQKKVIKWHHEMLKYRMVDDECHLEVMIQSFENISMDLKAASISQTSFFIASSNGTLVKSI